MVYGNAHTEYRGDGVVFVFYNFFIIIYALLQTELRRLFENDPKPVDFGFYAPSFAVARMFRAFGNGEAEPGKRFFKVFKR